jgi:hypothetical protein
LLPLQSYMPELAYHGIISGYNRHGARIYLVGSEYHAALLQAAGLPPAAAAAAGAPAAVPAAEKQPQEVPVGQAPKPEQQQQ